jgi:glycosyltransferase involved in cell wall biosynthesis
MDEMEKHKVENIVIVPVANEEMEKDEKSLNRYVYKIPCFNKIDKLFFFKKQKKIINAIAKKELFIENKINLIHAHTLFTSGFLARKLSDDQGVKYIVSVRNVDVNVFFKYGFFLRRRAINVLMQAEKIIFINPSYKNKVFTRYIGEKEKKKIQEKSFVIPNGIDSFWLNKKSYLKNFDYNESINLIQTSVINKNKNIKGLINSYELLKKRGYSVKVHVIGDGLLLNKYTKEYKNNTDIKFYGRLNKEDILSIYKKENSIFFMNSKHETFGLVYIEAMSQGLPIIYTQGEGIDGYFKEGEVGYAIPYGDVDIAVECIERIIENYNEISERCLVKSSVFSWDKINNHYLKNLIKMELE